VIDVSIEPRQLHAGRECDLEVRFSNRGTGACTDVVFKLGLPPQVLLLRGRSRMEIPEVAAGDTCVRSVTVRPRAPGECMVTSANFSYRNEYGTPVRVPAFRAVLEVVPGQPGTGPAVTAAVVSGSLTAGEWDELRFRVRNTGPSHLRDLSLVISGPVRIAPPGRAYLPSLGAGLQAEVSFRVCPTAAGRGVPVELHITYGDEVGRPRAQDEFVPLVVDSLPAGHRPPAGRRDTDPGIILHLAASPDDLVRLRSDKEMREIHEQLQLGKARDHFRLVSAHATRLKDIGQALADNDPQIVHFAGHGRPDGALEIEDEMGYSVPVAAAGLAQLFGLHARTIDCVIVNACHSLLLAEAITEHIDHAIGMRCEIGDATAIKFSVGFYQGLASGSSVADAFKRGRSFLQTEAQAKQEHGTPVLLGRGGRVLA
jgi:CHAT domain